MYNSEFDSCKKCQNVPHVVNETHGSLLISKNPKILVCFIDRIGIYEYFHQNRWKLKPLIEFHLLDFSAMDSGLCYTHTHKIIDDLLAKISSVQRLFLFFIHSSRQCWGNLLQLNSFSMYMGYCCCCRMYETDRDKCTHTHFMCSVHSLLPLKKITNIYYEVPLKMHKRNEKKCWPKFYRM